jgi:hypothetical protein
LLLVVLGACAKPAVTIEQVRRDTSTASRNLIGQVNPPACGTLPVPAYPELAVRQRPEHVAVRVDLTIDEQGLPTRVRASVVEPVEPTQPFVDASLDAANRIRCKPAQSLERADDKGLVIRNHVYKSSLVFHFHRDEKDATVGP